MARSIGEGGVGVLVKQGAVDSGLRTQCSELRTQDSGLKTQG